MLHVTYNYGFPEHIPNTKFTSKELLEPIYDRFDGRITREAEQGLDHLFSDLTIPSITRHYDKLMEALDCMEELDQSDYFTLSHALIVADAIDIPLVNERAQDMMTQNINYEVSDELVVPVEDIRSYTSTMLDNMGVTRPKHPFMDLTSDQQMFLLAMYEDADKPFEDALAQAQLMVENTPSHKETQDLIEDTLLQGNSILRKEDLVGLSGLSDLTF